MASAQATPAPHGERPPHHGESPAAVALHSVDAPALPASAPRRADTNAYAAHVLAWLKRHQQFPEDHVRDAFDATVLIAFTIDHRGRAGDIRIVRGSGVAWLDALALRQVRNASPFPRPFKFAPAQALRFEVPMRYRARG
ncbi:energy transducer TonB [Sphingomonas sp. R647]|uniref:energy transducer TonB n=1 Tax=Sphingomonas sp. R647 TaxID=2875233 RepID=UPI001CD57952|nr:TonB family protein [Sphingomonas sp. R647]